MILRLLHDVPAPRDREIFPPAVSHNRRRLDETVKLYNHVVGRTVYNTSHSLVCQSGCQDADKEGAGQHLR